MPGDGPKPGHDVFTKAGIERLLQHPNARYGLCQCLDFWLQVCDGAKHSGGYEGYAFKAEAFRSRTSMHDSRSASGRDYFFPYVES